jgi:hypothetical protein
LERGSFIAASTVSPRLIAAATLTRDHRAARRHLVEHDHPRLSGAADRLGRGLAKDGIALPRLSRNPKSVKSATLTTLGLGKRARDGFPDELLLRGIIPSLTTCGVKRVVVVQRRLG